MKFIRLEKNDGIAELILERGKVNALNPIVIDEMKTAFESLEDDQAVAGGCMLALACDYIIMAAGRAKISLNEIGFGIC